MYEGVAIVEDRADGKLLISIAEHNITETKYSDSMVVYFKQKGKHAFPFTHALQHAGDPYSCVGCLAAVQEKAKMVEEEARREREKEAKNAHRGGDPPPFEVSPPRPALVVDTAQDAPGSNPPSESSIQGGTPSSGSTR